MELSSRTLTTVEQNVLNNDLTNIQDWVTAAIDGKIASCKKRMIAEWTPILMADESVDSIPANEDDLIALIVARDDYQTRSECDAESEEESE